MLLIRKVIETLIEESVNELSTGLEDNFDSDLVTSILLNLIKSLNNTYDKLVFSKSATDAPNTIYIDDSRLIINLLTEVLVIDVTVDHLVAKISRPSGSFTISKLDIEDPNKLDIDNFIDNILVYLNKL